MTGRELRVLARTVLGEQLRAENVDTNRVYAAVQVLTLPERDSDSEVTVAAPEGARLMVNMEPFLEAASRQK